MRVTAKIKAKRLALRNAIKSARAALLQEAVTIGRPTAVYHDQVCAAC